jgi:putative ABC transport system ATP-binding protein
MLVFEKVTKKFQLDAANTIAPVQDVSLKVEPGELIIIVGRSGTGKTTLLNLAAGLVKPSSGQVSIDGHNLQGMNDKQLSALRSRRMGFVFQFPSLLAALTVKENVTLPAIFTGEKKSPDTDARAVRILEKIGLGSKANVYPRQLSAGEQKRVVIARALINQPKLILADEPTSDLDTRTEEEVMDILREINSQGVTFLIVTHSLQLVPLATRAFEMKNGGLEEITPGKKVLQKVDVLS